MADRQGLWVWRHPRPEGAVGLCVGAGCDLPVHWRRAKRLARRIQALARRQRLAHEVWTSPLQRCAASGRWLRRWGWRHRQLDALSELAFGAWDGRPWSAIPKAEIDAWVADFAGFAAGGGESLQQLLQRVQDCTLAPGALVISHGGWMLARRWWLEQGQVLPTASQWPAPPRYGQCWRL